MADNIFITAFIGGGKSLCGVRFVCNELANTERLISTSLPLFIDDHWQVVPKTKRFKLPVGLPSWWIPEATCREIENKPDSMELWAPGLATWCHNEIQKPVNLNNRLRLLTHEEVPRFYLHLPNQDLPEIVNAMPGRKPVVLPDLTKRTDSGCLFLIDEVHIYFSARNYLESGPGVEVYQSQLRHLNDDMVMISQHLEKVDKNFRRNCTKTYELNNLGNQKLFGGVTLKERFNWKLYSGVPQRGDRPIEKGSFKLRDKGMCYLYDTMAGVGVSGGMKADSPPKGRHWSYWIILLVLLLACAYMLPRMVMLGFGYGMGSLMGSIQKGVTGGIGPKVSAQVISQAQSKTVNAVVTAAPDRPTPDDSQEDQKVTCQGFAAIPNYGVVAFLSDGARLSSRSGTLKVATDGGVYDISGKFYPVRMQLPEFLPAASQSLPEAGYFHRGPAGPVSVSYIGGSSFVHQPKIWNVPSGFTDNLGAGHSQTSTQVAAPSTTSLQGGGSYAP